MRRIVYIFLFSVIYITVKCQTQYDNALKRYYNGELSAAVDLFSQCIAGKEKTALSYMYRGAARAFLGSFDEAFNDLKTSYGLDSANDKIHYYFGKYYVLNKQYAHAAEYFKKSILRKKDDPDRYDALATAEIFLENYKNAVEHENQAIQLDPNQGDYFLNRGFAKLKLNQYENAIRDLSTSLSKEKSYKGYFDRAVAYSQLKMYSKAIEDFNASLSMYPENAEAIYYRGLTFKYMDKKDEACKDFKHSLTLGFTDATKAIDTYCR